MGMPAQGARQASVEEIEVTPEMAAAGVLKRHISMDFEPIFWYEELLN
jgi:hypothetical protein